MFEPLSDGYISEVDVVRAIKHLSVFSTSTCPTESAAFTGLYEPPTTRQSECCVADIVELWIANARQSGLAEVPEESAGVAY